MGVITYAADGTVLDTAFLAEIRQEQVMLERGGRAIHADRRRVRNWSRPIQ